MTAARQREGHGVGRREQASGLGRARVELTQQPHIELTFRARQREFQLGLKALGSAPETSRVSAFPLRGDACGDAGEAACGAVAVAQLGDHGQRGRVASKRLRGSSCRELEVT